MGSGEGGLVLRVSDTRMMKGDREHPLNDRGSGDEYPNRQVSLKKRRIQI